jgi:hypothetical protein
MVVGYSSSRASNNWLKVKMERGVATGMKREGIVFDESSTEWASYPRVVRYSSRMAGNNWLKIKMEKGVVAGMKREGIVFNQGSTEWASYPTTICDDCGR